MTEVIHAASDLQGVCLVQGRRFCFIGGLALQRWGEPRETVDADLTLLTGFGEANSPHRDPNLLPIAKKKIVNRFGKRAFEAHTWTGASIGVA